MIEFAVEARHENVEVRLERAQVVDGLLVDFVDHAGVEVGGIDGLRADRQDAVEDGDVHVGGLLGDAVKRQKFELRRRRSRCGLLTSRRRSDCR